MLNPFWVLGFLGLWASGPRGFEGLSVQGFRAFKVLP